MHWLCSVHPLGSWDAQIHVLLTVSDAALKSSVEQKQGWGLRSATSAAPPATRARGQPLSGMTARSSTFAGWSQGLSNAAECHFRSKCHKAFKRKKNPRKAKWTKAFRKSAGKELAVDPSFEFEKKRWHIQTTAFLHVPNFNENQASSFSVQECSGQVRSWALAELHQCYAGLWSSSQLSSRISVSGGFLNRN